MFRQWHLLQEKSTPERQNIMHTCTVATYQTYDIFKAGGIRKHLACFSGHMANTAWSPMNDFFVLANIICSLTSGRTCTRCLRSAAVLLTHGASMSAVDVAAGAAGGGLPLREFSYWATLVISTLTLCVFAFGCWQTGEQQTEH